MIKERSVVIPPVTAFGARIAEEKLKVLLVRAHLQPALFRSGHCSLSHATPDRMVLGS